MGVQSHNMFSNPENRRQAIQQFAVNGIDMKPIEHLLNTGHWEIRKLTEHTFSKSLDSYQSLERFEKPLDGISSKDIIDDVEMKKGHLSHLIT